MNEFLSSQMLLSGRIKKTPSGLVSEDRYQWLSLQEAEPDLGLPLENDSVLIGDTTGTRAWSKNLNVDITGTAVAATNIAGGLALEIPVQIEPGITTFIPAPAVPEKFLAWDGEAFVWTASTGFGGGFTSTDDNLTNADYFPIFVTQPNGTIVKSSSTKLKFNPFTGTITVDNITVTSTLSGADVNTSEIDNFTISGGDY